MHLRIGARSSPLAIKQVEIFIEHFRNSKEIISTLGKNREDFTYEIIKINTKGDKITDKALYNIGGKALFLKELEYALSNDEIDIAVHSLKDVPGMMSEEFRLGCFIGRDYPFDAFLSIKYQSILELPIGARVGTCSPRRIVSLRQLRPDLNIGVLRGNIGTRIKKLSDDEFDAIILAEAGLRRLNLWDNNFCYRIASDVMIPAIGQGIIVAQALVSRVDLLALFEKCERQNFVEKLLFEREFLRLLSADCDSPVAAFIDGSYGSGGYIGHFMYAKTIGATPKFITAKLPSLDLEIARDMAQKILL